jgi:hypothetical protein
MLRPGKRKIGGTQASWGGVDGRLDGNPKRPVIYFSDTLGCSKCRKRERDREMEIYIFSGGGEAHIIPITFAEALGCVYISIHHQLPPI